MKALEGLNAALANKKVRVVAQGSTAKTDGKTVYIPYLGDNLTDLQLTLLSGYNDHESEHVLDTDMETMRAAFREGGERLGKVLNIVEDIRIENTRARRYAGAYKNLQALNQHIFNTPESDPFNQILYEGRRQIIGFKYDMPVVADRIKAYFGDDIFENIRKAENSWDCLNIARAMVTTHEENNQAKKEAQQQENQADQGRENDNQQQQNSSEQNAGDEELDEQSANPAADIQDNDDSEGFGGSGDDEQDEMDDDQQGSGDVQDEQDIEDDLDNSEQNHAQGGSRDEASGCDAEEDDSGDRPEIKPARDQANAYDENDIEDALDNLADPMDKMRDELSKWHEDVCATGAYMPYTTKNDQVVEVKPANNTIDYDILKSELGGLNSMRAKVVQMFKARTARRWYGGQNSGKIDTRKLASIRNGNSKVFKRRTTNVEIDTAVTFVIDQSGSMIGDRIKEAVQATILLMETLNGAGLKTEITGFTTDGKPEGSPATTSHPRFDRVEGVINYVYKSFNETFNRTVKRRISALRNQRNGQTCDFEGLKFAYHRMAKINEKRRIIIMLSDGDTCFWGNINRTRQHMKQMIREIEAQGIEILAYGLHDYSVQQYYKNHVIVEEHDSLSERVLEGLKKILHV